MTMPLASLGFGRKGVRKRMCGFEAPKHVLNIVERWLFVGNGISEL